MFVILVSMNRSEICVVLGRINITILSLINSAHIHSKVSTQQKQMIEAIIQSMSKYRPIELLATIRCTKCHCFRCSFVCMVVSHVHVYYKEAFLFVTHGRANAKFTKLEQSLR